MSNQVPAYAMILAAGRGTRMRPLTDTQPKPMLPVNGQPLIFYHLHKLAAAGVRHVVINHAWLGNMLQQAIGDGGAFGVQVHWSAEPQGGLETAGGILHALPHLGGADFIVVNGDVWSDYDYARLQKLTDSRLGHLVLVDNPVHHPQGDFGLIADGLNELIVQKPNPRAPTYTFAGVSVLSTQLFKGHEQGFYKLRPFFERAIQQQCLSGEHYSGQWCDVGTPERLAQLDAQLRRQNKVGS